MIKTLYSIFMRKQILIILLLISSIAFSSTIKDFLINDEDVTYFTELIKGYFSEKEFEVIISPDYITVKNSPIYAGELGLLNLADSCSVTDKSLWKDLIYTHFNNIQQAKEAEKISLNNTTDYNSIKDILIPRLYPIYYHPENVKENSLVYSLSDDLDIYIVFDLPTAVRTVTLTEFKSWGKTKKEILEIAKQNLKIQYTLKNEKIQLKPNQFINYLYCSSEIFNGSQILTIKNNKEILGEFGILIAIPNRLGVITYPIEDSRTLSFIDEIVPVTIGMYNEGPGSTSYNLLWYYNDMFTHIPLLEKNGNYFYDVPEALLNLIKR